MPQPTKTAEPMTADAAARILHLLFQSVQVTDNDFVTVAELIDPAAQVIPHTLTVRFTDGSGSNLRADDETGSTLVGHFPAGEALFDEGGDGEQVFTVRYWDNEIDGPYTYGFPLNRVEWVTLTTSEAPEFFVPGKTNMGLLGEES